MDKYEKFVCANAPVVASIESSLRTLTYILPGTIQFQWRILGFIYNLLPSFISCLGRFKNADISSEAGKPKRMHIVFRKYWDYVEYE